jgi:hypothetical protein
MCFLNYVIPLIWFIKKSPFFNISISLIELLIKKENPEKIEF